MRLAPAAAGAAKGLLGNVVPRGGQPQYPSFSEAGVYSEPGTTLALGARALFLPHFLSLLKGEGRRILVESGTRAPDQMSRRA